MLAGHGRPSSHLSQWVGDSCSTENSSPAQGRSPTSTGHWASWGGGTATIVVFDVLAVDGDVVPGLPYHQRRTLLESLDLAGLLIAPRFPGVDLDPLLESCEDLRMGGVVLKRSSSNYRPGRRSSDRREVKSPGWRDHGHLERRHLMMG